jgi:hypothetical protein
LYYEKNGKIKLLCTKTTVTHAEQTGFKIVVTTNLGEQKSGVFGIIFF